MSLPVPFYFAIDGKVEGSGSIKRQCSWAPNPSRPFTDVECFRGDKTSHLCAKIIDKDTAIYTKFLVTIIISIACFSSDRECSATAWSRAFCSGIKLGHVKEPSDTTVPQHQRLLPMTNACLSIRHFPLAVMYTRAQTTNAKSRKPFSTGSDMQERRNKARASVPFKLATSEQIHSHTKRRIAGLSLA